MIVSKSHNFVFVHNPKVAGSAIRSRIEEFHTAERIFWHQGYVPELDRMVDLAHLTYQEASRILPEVRTYFSFGFVRDPYERFISAFNEHCRQHDRVLDINDLDALGIDEISARFNWKFVHFCPQHYFFCKNGKIQTDYVGRYENLEESWSYVQGKINIEHECLKVVRNSEESYGVEFLSPEVIRWINSFYRLDFQIFGYERIGDIRPIPAEDHYSRVNKIHTLGFLSAEEVRNLTEGERKLWANHKPSLEA